MKPRSSHSIKSKIEFSALSHVACWDGDRASREGKGERFESLNLYGLLRYQALRTRSDADTFVEGWQISCPSRCLIAWPLFTKWWWWWGGDSGKWCPCQWGACKGNAHFTLSISIPNEHDGNTIQTWASSLSFFSVLTTWKVIFVCV